jgi:hypothetical protein
MQVTYGSTSAIRIPTGRVAGYWITTVLVTFELVASFIWVVVGTQYVVNNLTHLGYPLYLQHHRGFRFTRCRGVARPWIHQTQGMGVRRCDHQVRGRGGIPHVHGRWPSHMDRPTRLRHPHNYILGTASAKSPHDADPRRGRTTNCTGMGCAAAHACGARNHCAAHCTGLSYPMRILVLGGSGSIRSWVTGKLRSARSLDYRAKRRSS